MARRHTPAASSKKNRRRPSHTCEWLEPRTYFVVLHDGDVFEFFAENQHYERVVVGGNPGSTTIELVGARINTQTGQFSITPMQGVLDGSPVNGGFVNANNGQGGGNTPQVSDTIYSIYIAKSDVSTRIAIAGVPDLTATPRPMQPFTNSIGSLRVNTRVPPSLISAPGNTGNALLGARTVNVQGQQGNDNRPIFAPQPLPAGMFSTIPSNITSLGAGLTVAPGNNLGEFLFGGTILGTVNIQGSIQLFYGGWILTGNATGALGVGTSSNTPNFDVAGDIQDLLTNATLGADSTGTANAPVTNINYLSGFNMHVGGRIGMVQSLDGIVGNIHADNSPTAPNLNGVSQIELEVIGPPAFDPWDTPSFGADPLLNNDTFQNPQILGTADSGGDIQVDGEIQSEPAPSINDIVDYYAVGLLAGQTITLRLTGSFLGTFLPGVSGLNVGVFDPEGRLIATDFSLVDPNSITGQPFQVKATMPGAYRIAITPFINPTFTAGPPPQGDFFYTLQASGAGNLGIGGIEATNNILDNANLGLIFNGNGTLVQKGFEVGQGDLGSVIAGGDVLTNDANAAVSVVPNGQVANIGAFTFAVDNGNLRSVQGFMIGFCSQQIPEVATNTTTNFPGVGNGPTASVPNGSVGLLQATDAGNVIGNVGCLVWNLFIGTDTNGVTTELTKAQSSAAAIGGDYQMVDSANILVADLIANGNIGTIRGARIGAGIPGYYQVNASYDPNRHGTIDLIDASQNLGLAGPGGPAITTGPGGNVRYIHAPATLGANQSPFAFRDAFFGGGTPEATNYQPGEAVAITDDSGTIVHLTPDLATAAMLVTTYPIRGSGGAAIVQVESANGVTVTADGNGSAEIGTIQVDGTGGNTAIPAAGGTGGTGTGGSASRFPQPGQPGGAPTGTGTNTRFTQPPAPGVPTLVAGAASLPVTISGTTRIDVWEISSEHTPAGDGSLVPTLGHVTSITNSTPHGEIINVHVTSAGSITSNGTVGIPLTQNTAAPLMGAIHAPLSEDTSHGQVGQPWSFPFDLPTNIIRVTGNIGSITGREGVGNVYAGFVQQSPTADPIPTPGAPPNPVGGSSVIVPGTDGNVGPIAGPLLGPIVTAGTISSVTANGISWTGSGAVGYGGIFSSNTIGPVTVNGDDRGAIVSARGTLGITINGGSMLNGVVGSFVRFDSVEPRGLSFLSIQEISPVTRPLLDIGPITVNGNGGIIGSFIAGVNVAPIKVSNSGYGIFDTRIFLTGQGTLQGITVGGYGLRDGLLEGGALLGTITVNGDGSNVPVTQFSSSVRTSELGATFDPVTGYPLDFINDIDTYLGTTASVSQINGVTDTGVIEDWVLRGSRDVSSISAWSMRGRDLDTTNTIKAFTVLAGTFPQAVAEFDIANSLGNLNVIGPVNGLNVTTGRGFKFRFGGDVSGMNMTIAGPLKNLVFLSSLMNNSAVNATGPNGKISNLTIHGNFNGNISATTQISHVVIDGSIVGTIQANYLGYLRMGGGLGAGSLSINTNVGTIIAVSDLSSPNNTLTINGSINRLQVGGNLNTNVSVAQNLKQLIVGGSVLSGSNVTVANTINLLKIGGDVQAGAVIKAHVIKQRVVKGQVLGSILTV